MEITHEVDYERTKPSRLDLPFLSQITLNWETVLFATILVLAFTTRIYDLGIRVMSHDETSHVYFSWRLYKGEGYQHDPVTHGPLQFHLLALSYFLIGDSDFSARLPAALFGVATIAFMWNYRRYLGRVGAIVAALLLLISPYMLYYSRYARNEAFIGLFGVMLLWAILRYLDTGASRYIYWVTAATILHFTAKETAYIYTAQAILFLAIYFLFRVLQKPWSKPEDRRRFQLAISAGILLLVSAVGLAFLSKSFTPISATETVQPAVPGEQTPASLTGSQLSPAILIGGLALVVLAIAVYYLIRGYTLPKMREERSFDLLILIVTLVLPLLTAFPVKLLGWNPTDYSNQGILRTASVLIPLALISIAIGLWWNPRIWIGNAAVFYIVFTVFYTTIFTNGAGFFTGLVGSLGYWLEQQGVHRGSQPWYYFIFLQIPFYEFLPAIGSLMAFGLALIKWPIRNTLSTNRPEATISPQDLQAIPSTAQQSSGASSDGKLFTGHDQSATAVTLLGFWSITSILAYTYAGEKMPWLTVHMTWPMILLTGWAIGLLIETTDWKSFLKKRGSIILLLLPVFLLSLIAVLGSLLGTNPPFQGKGLTQLQSTSTFITALLTLIGSAWGLIHLTKAWQPPHIGRIFILGIFSLLAVLTARSAFLASYINYNDATEFLVYAHSGPGSKEILNQIEDISRRTTDGLALQVAYDDDTTYPFWWYLRNYPNQRFYGSAPTRDLRDVPIILVGSKNFGKVEQVVGQAYYEFDYIRMWWPNQDYFNLDWSRIWYAISNPQMRKAISDIWLNRDYTLYGQLTNKDMSLPKWSPSDPERMYIRKDVAASLWNYGVGPSPQEVVVDPYEGKQTKLNADILWGTPGTTPGQFQRPRGIAVAPDGTLYVADTENNRIQHLTRDGQVIQVWGEFADIAAGPAPGGTFNQPWGIALSPDGAYVYVTDVWNHRIQKFTAQGEFVTMWGYFGQAENPDAFWGPRDVVIDSSGRVLVTDTGNKRIVIFDEDGNPITQFGSAGFALGQFDEPVGLALDQQNHLYVADTWNQRIQVFTPDNAGSYTPLSSWDVYTWSGQTWDNKPYLAVDSSGHVFATDPEGSRVLEFTTQGEIVRFWGDFGTDSSSFGLAGAVAVDPNGGVWVTDTGNGRVMHFTLPPG